MKITRRFTKAGQDPFATVDYDLRDSRISNPDGSVVFEMKNAEIPKQWSQLATDIMVSKYFRKAGVPQTDLATGQPLVDDKGNPVLGPEKSAKQVIGRLAGCWRFWAESHGYFDSADDAQAFYDELAYMMVHQMCAPNSPQWFNTGLNHSYGITGPAQGHFYCDPKTGELKKSKDAYSHPQPHACQPYDALISTPQGPITIGEIFDKKLTGLEVFDGTLDGRGTTRVVATKCNGEKPVFRIVLKNGLFVEATGDHVVWALDERRSAGRWARVDALSPGQRMQVSTVTSVTKTSDESDVVEAGLVGWLQGDGFVGQYTEGTNRSLTCEFMTINDDEHEFVLRGIARVFEGVHYNVRAVESQDDALTIRRVRLYGEKLRPFVEKYDLLGTASDRKVPAAVRRAGALAQAAYLRSVFQTDGTVRRRQRAGSKTSDVVLTTISSDLASGVQALLLNHGIYSRVQRGVEKRTNRRVPYFVSIGYDESRQRFLERVGFISQEKQGKLESTCDGSFPGKDLPPLREESIQRIELVGTMPVYDIQTESSQYLCNNVLVHNCFIQSVKDDLVGEGGIMDLWTREARLFKYGSGTGSNFSRVRGDGERLAGGGRSSGLMSFLKIGDRAAGAIKSGGTTRRAAKMVCLDLDHPDIEDFINWKVREELKVAALAEGMKILPKDQQELAKKLGLKLDYDFNGEAYATVSGQNSNNSVRIPNSFFKAVEDDGDWTLTFRTNGKVAKTLKARTLWDEIAFAAWRCADPGVQYDDTINQWHTCPKSGRINASNPCVTGDTRVLTPGGIWRRIDQMIHLPSRVVTNLSGQEIHVTEGAFPTGTKDTFELKTAGGYSVKLTADHKVWTRKRGWVEARLLTTADDVRLPSRPACVYDIGEPQDAKFFQLAGLFLSDSNTDHEALNLNHSDIDEQTLDDLSTYVRETWSDTQQDYTYAHAGAERAGEAARATPDASDYSDHLNASGDEGSLATQTLTHGKLISRVRAYVRGSGKTKRLSDDAFTAGLAAQKHLLRALFSADAEIKNGTLELTSRSTGFLHDVQMLLLGFGVQCSVHSFIDNGGAVARGGDASTRGGLTSTRGGLTSPHGSGISTRGGAASARGGSSSNRMKSGSSKTSIDEVSPRHGLRVDPGSLRFFGKNLGLLPGTKLASLAQAISFSIERASTGVPDDAHYDRVATLTPLGKQQVFDLTEPVTHSFIANGITVHNCSEYMFLDDTACNLASLNVLTFFDPECRRFDIEGYKHAVRIWTIVLETSVLMASFPSEDIARLSYRYRTLGLGYANLGAMLMQAGIPYDSDKGRAVCAALSSILTGESYATSSELAKELGAFPGYQDNKNEMLRVIRNHRRAAHGVKVANTTKAHGSQSVDDYETLDIHPVEIDASQFSPSDPLASKQLLDASRECWDRALSMGEKHGYRNAQTTVIAPTGTIGLLMDCDTTGVEPDFALVKFKKLAGGGYFKIVNQSLPPALKNLNYSPEQINDMLRYVLGTMSLHDTPHVNRGTLLTRGFTESELDKIESQLPGMFELSFAFSAWTLGADFFKRLDIPESEWQAPGFNLLRKLGYSARQINEANDVVCGSGTVEGAPHLKDEHLAVFDCANKCGKTGKRFIHVDGHIKMMAAAQPFISGAISKTINLPNEATIDDIKKSYQLSWELGLKSNALYRDGSKLSQPLNVKSDEDLDKKTDEEDADAIADAKKEITASAAHAAASAAELMIKSDNIEPAQVKVIEKIVERIVERPLRRRLPDTRHAVTHKFDVAGHEGYITTGLYEDGTPGEVFITMAKEGSTVGGLMDCIATLVSVSLQYGVPVESLVRKFEHVRFEPSGMTRNADIPMAKSLVDYIFRWLAMEFVPGYRAANAPQRTKKPAKQEILDKAAAFLTETLTEKESPAIASRGMTDKTPGNGHGPRLTPDPNQGFDYTGGTQAPKATETQPIGGLRLALVADPLSQQSTSMQADAPACDVCGSITVRSGTCYKCQNCGNSMGCS